METTTTHCSGDLIATRNQSFENSSLKIFTPANLQNCLQVLFFVCALLFCSFNGWGQTTKTASTGNWNTASTWSPSGVPAANDPVIIPGGVTLTVDVNNAVCNSLTISPSSNNTTGTIRFNSNSQLTVTGMVTLGSSGNNRQGHLDMTSGGTLICNLISLVNSRFTPGSGTINYNGSGTTIAALPYNNLTLSGSGSRTISSVITVTGLLSIAPTGTATASITAGQTISVGSLNIGGLRCASGTWGSTSSAAVYKNNNFFTATTGILSVTNDSRNTAATITPIIGTYTYNGNSQGPNSVTTNSSGTVSYNYTGTGSTSYGPSSTAPTNAGTYTVRATVGEDGNYLSGTSVATPFTIGQKNLTITGLTGVNKTYDGTTAASAIGTAVLSGVVSPDVISLGGSPVYTFASANAGTGISITTAGFTISGTNAGNYTLTQPTLTASINPAALTITGITANSKIYDGATATTISGTPGYAGLLPGENFSVTGTPIVNFSTATAGTGKSVIVTGYTAPNSNYSITQPSLVADITPKTLTISNPAVTTKIYSSTTAAVITGTLSGIVGTDVVILNGIGTFDNKNVGTNKPVTAYCSLNGANASNYTLTQPVGLTGTIIPRTLSITAPTVASKVYDGSSVSGTVTPGTLSGTAWIETIGVTATGNYADANIGTGKTATVVYTLSDGLNGGLASNYTLANGTASGDITPKALSITANSLTKCAGIATNFNGTEFTSDGLISGDLINSVTLTSTGVPSTAIAGVYDILASAASGARISNYTISYIKGSLTINPNLPASVSIASSDADNTICSGTSVTFTATPVNGGNAPAYQWRLNGLNVGTNSNTFTTATLANGDQVSVVLTSNANPCLTGSPATSNVITTIVNTIGPASVTIQSSATANQACSGSTVTFTATRQNEGTAPSYQWFLNSAAVSGATTASYSSSTLADGDRVSLTMTSNYACLTGSPAVNSNTIIMGIASLPSAPVAIANSRCGSGTVNISASVGSGITVDWYSASTGGTPLISGSLNYTTPVISSTTNYFAQARNTSTGCLSSARTSVSASVNSIPTITGTTPNFVCNSGTVTLGATASAGTINWYASPTGGTSMGTGNSYTTPSISTAVTYYVDATSNGCTTSSRTAVNANVISVTAPSVVNSQRCNAGTVTLTATPKTGETIDWFLNLSGGSALSSGSVSYTTPTISATTTYYAQSRNTSNGCTSVSRSPVIANVYTAVPAAPGVISGQTNVCANSTNLNYSVAAVSNAFSYSWTVPAGWSITNGQGMNSITVTSGSLTNDGNITVAASNACGISISPTGTQTIDVFPSNLPNHTGYTSSSLKTDGNIQCDKFNEGFIRFPLSAISRDFTVTSASLTLVINSSSATNETNTIRGIGNNIDPVTATAAALYNQIAAGTVFNTGIWNSTGSTTLTLNTSAITDINSRIAASTGYFALGLDRTATGNATFVFNGRNGGETAPKLTVTYTAPRLLAVNVTDPQPPAAVNGYSCNASASLTISATPGTGETVDWYAAPSGGTALRIGSNSFTTPVVNSTTTYYAQSRNTTFGCVSQTRTAVIASANPSVSITADYCADPGNVVLNAVPEPSVGNYTYAWRTIPQTISFNPTKSISIDISGKYEVTVTNTAIGCVRKDTIQISTELATNGDFEQGNTGFTLPSISGRQYIFVPDRADSTELIQEGRYSVGSNARAYHPNFWGKDHTNPGTGKFMIVNGYPGVPQPVVWQNNITVAPNTKYYFSAWAMSLNSQGNYAQLRFSINGVNIGTTAALAPHGESLSAADNWTRFYGTWTSGPNETQAVCEIVDLQTAIGGNDFGLDDISISTIAPYIELTSSVSTSNQNVCINSPIQPIRFNVGTGGVGPIVGNLPPGVTADYRSGRLTISGSPTATGTYNYSITTQGCSIQTFNGQIVVNALPAVHTVTGGGSYCAGGTGIQIGLSNTENGVNYQLVRDGSANIGSPVAGTGATISFGNQTEAGTYTVLATSSATSCSITMSGSASIIINALPTLSGVARGNTVLCAGSVATITLNGVTNGTQTISYTIGGTPGTQTVSVNATGNTVQFNTIPLTADNSEKILTITDITRTDVTPACSFVPTSNNTIALQVVNPISKWIGAVNRNWDEPANWCGAIPQSNTNVVIGKMNNDPIVNMMASVNNLTIEAGATMDIASGMKLRINGNITSVGQINASQGTIEMGGTNAQNISGRMFAEKKINTLMINNASGVNVISTGTDTLKIIGSIEFSTTPSLLNVIDGGNLTLVSSAERTASIGKMTANNRLDGNVTVERYIHIGTAEGMHGKGWQLLAAPTRGQTIKQAWQEGATTTNVNNNNNAGNPRPGFGTMITSNLGGNTAGALGLGFDAFTAPGPSMKTYNSATGNWEGVSSTNIPIHNSKGYMVFVRGDRSVFTHNAAATTTIMRSTGALYQPMDPPPAIIIPDTGIYSIANPYASAIDMTKINTTGSVNRNQFFVFDPTLRGSYNLGGYQTITIFEDLGLATPAGTRFYSQVFAQENRYVQSGQAFFMQATNPAGGSGTISFSENAKLSGSRLVNRPIGTKLSMISTNLLAQVNSNAELADGNRVVFNDAYSDDVDYIDAKKIRNAGENFSIRRSNQLITVEARHNINEADTLFYDISNLKKMNYQLMFIPENLPAAELSAELIDKFLNLRTAVSLTDTSFVSFSVNDNAASMAPDRFMLVFKTVARPVPVTFIHISARRNGNASANVSWKVAQETNLKEYGIERSADGRIFNLIGSETASSNNGNAAAYDFSDVQPSEGFNYYRIKAIGKNGQVQYSNIARINPVGSKETISVYPNPIVNKTAQIHFDNSVTGNYRITVTNSSGQTVAQKTVQTISKGEVKSVTLDNLPTGKYNISITGPDYKTTVLESIVQ